MKSICKTFILASTFACATNASAYVVSLDFTNFEVEPGSPTLLSTGGDIWRATNVRMDAGPAMDAVFTITASSGVTSAKLQFVDNPARGNNVRVVVTDVIDSTVNITISLVNAGTSIPYTGWAPEETLIAQFSDLDSDSGSDRSDFAGVRSTHFTEARTSDNVVPGSSLLTLVANPSYAPGYTTAILETPWSSQGNVTATDPSSQSPVTAAFLMDARNTIDIAVGQQSNGPVANRHIDIDMTPDFQIIPEPTTTLLGGIGMLALLRRRRR